MNKNKEKAPVIIAVMTGAKLYYTDIKTYISIIVCAC